MIFLNAGEDAEVSVHFGGGIETATGRYGHTGQHCVSLRALMQPRPVGDKLDREETHGVRVVLVFKDPKSIDVVMKVLRLTKKQLTAPPKPGVPAKPKTKKKGVSGGKGN